MIMRALLLLSNTEVRKVGVTCPAIVSSMNLPGGRGYMPARPTISASASELSLKIRGRVFGYIRVSRSVLRTFGSELNVG